MTVQEEIEVTHLRHLASALDSLRVNTTLTDITLICGEQEFHAHRLILAATSPYFESMFRSEWKDASCKRYDLPDWSAATASAILSFMYTGQLKDVRVVEKKETMLQLLEAADYFQIEDLVEYCFKTMCDLSLTITTFWEIYFLADKFNNQGQIRNIEKLLSPNISEMCRSEDFLQLNKQHIKNILQHPDVDHCCMDEVLNGLLKWAEYDDQRNSLVNELLDVLRIYWCPLRLNDLISENILIGNWTSKTKRLLSEIAASHCIVLRHHQFKSDNRILFCFREDTVHSYDLEKDEWLPTKQLPFVVDHRAATVVYHHHIFFFGGEIATQSGNNSPNSIVQYCPFSNSMISSGELLFAVNYAGAAVFKETIYVVNGQDTNPESFKMVQHYEPTTEECQQVASTLNQHYRPLVFTCENYLFAFGASPYIDKSLDRYDPVPNQWTELTTVSRIPEIAECYHAAFMGTKLFCLSQSNLNYQMYTFDVLSEQIEIAELSGGPENIDALWSTIQNRRTFLITMDHHNAPHFYDVEAQLWVTKGKNNGHILCHHLSCCT